MGSGENSVDELAEKYFIKSHYVLKAFKRDEYEVEWEWLGPVLYDVCILVSIQIVQCLRKGNWLYPHDQWSSWVKCFCPDKMYYTLSIFERATTR